MTTNRIGVVTRRVIHSDGWVITQIAQPDGEWWNIRIERLSDVC